MADKRKISVEQHRFSRCSGKVNVDLFPFKSDLPAKTRNVSNTDIAVIFNEIADILEIEGANPYRVRAYRNAARTVETYGGDIAGILQGGKELPKLPGIGEDLLGKIHEIVDTGSCKLLGRLHKEVPQAIVNLLSIAGLGPKRVRLLYHDLGIDRKSTRLNSSHIQKSRMPSSA